MGEERLDGAAEKRLASLLELGDPNAEVALAYRVRERLRDFYRCADLEQARAMLAELQDHCVRRGMSPELQRLGPTIGRWLEKICNYHVAKMSNGPTEAVNNLIKGRGAFVTSCNSPSAGLPADIRRTA